MAEKRVIELEVKTTGSEKVEKSAKTVKQLYAEAKKELQEMALAYGENSQQAIEAAKKAGALKDVIDDTGEAIKNLQGGGAFSAVSTSLGNLAGGFGAVQGAINLVGVESEEVEAAILKLQSVMAISEGLRSIEDLGRSFGALKQIIVQSTIVQNLFTKSTVQQAVATGTATTAQKIMNTVMKANPIFLVIGAVTSLIGAYYLLSGSTDKATQEEIKRQKALKESNIESQKQYKAVSEESSAFVGLVYQLKQTNANSKERKNLIKEINSEYGTTLKNLSDETAFQNQLNLAVKEYIKQKENEYILKGNEEKIQKILKNRIELEEKRDKLERGTLLLRTSTLKYANDNNISIEEANKLAIQAEETLTKYNKQLGYYDQNLQSAAKSSLSLNQTEKDTQAERIERIERFKINEQELWDETLLGAKAIDDADLERQRLKNEADAEMTETISAFKIGVWENEAKNKEDLDKKALEAEKQLQQLKYEAVLGGLSLISDLAEVFGKKGTAQAKRAFQIQKGVSIASTTIETYKAAQSAYASQMTIPSPDAPIRASIAAGIAIAAGLGKVAKISSQKFEGGGAGGSGGAGGGGGTTPNQVTTPNFNIVGQNNANSLGLQTKPLQAYVVSGEVTTQQALDRNRLKNATFG
jgi:hypothetical protein